MAAKRARDQLTGGSNDVNPQYAHVFVTTSVANAFTESEIPLPALTMMGVTGMRGFSTKGPVLELLYVDWNYQGEAFNAAAEGYFFSISRNAQTTVLNFSNPECIMKYEAQAASGATDTGSYLMPAVGRYNFTAGDGHGLLVALPSNNSLRMQLDTIGLTATASVLLRLAYRIKLVPMAEFVGMLASS